MSRKLFITIVLHPLAISPPPTKRGQLSRQSYYTARHSCACLVNYARLKVPNIRLVWTVKASHYILEYFGQPYSLRGSLLVADGPKPGYTWWEDDIHFFLAQGGFDLRSL